VTLSFTSNPQGAEVYLGDQFVGVTPFSHVFDRADGEGSFELRKPGYETATRKMGFGKDDAVAVKLVAAVAAVPATSSAAAPPHGSSTSQTIARKKDPPKVPATTTKSGSSSNSEVLDPFAPPK
jgi:hypothetical protein